MPDPTKQTLSASEVPAVLGISDWSTRWMVMQRFAGNAIADRSDNRMNWGTLLQPLILEQAARYLALEIEQNRTDEYRRCGRLGYTADGWSRKPDKGPGVIEAKCCFDSHQWMAAWGGGKAPPRYVEAQLQTQMLVGDGTEPFAWGTIVCWYAGELHYFERAPIIELQQHIIDEAARFFDDLEAGRLGEPFGVPAESEMIARLFRPKRKKVLDLRDDMVRGLDLAADVIAMHENSDSASFHKKCADQYKARVRAAIADNEEVLLPHGVRVRAKMQHRTAFSVKESDFVVLSEYIPPGTTIERPETLTDTLSDILRAG